MRILTHTSILLGLFFAFNAHAASHRTFVSTEGTDSGGCGPTAPCRSFDYALTQTNSGGELIILKSGGYGNGGGGVTIDKSVSIIAEPGIFAALAPIAGYNGITIATAGINVQIKGLTISGRGGDYGIYMSNGASLKVEGCTISGFGNPSAIWTDNTPVAIYVNAPAKTTITDTVIKDNLWGIRFGRGAQASVIRTTAIGNGVGIAISGPSSDTANTVVSISESVATQGGKGFWVSTGTTGGYCTACAGYMTLSNSLASLNSSGVEANGANSTLRLSQNRIVDDTNGLYSRNSATVFSAGNNVFLNNGSDISGPSVTSVASSAFY